MGARGRYPIRRQNLNARTFKAPKTKVGVAVVISLVVVAVLAPVLILSIILQPPAQSSKAPNFSLVAHNGTGFALSDFDGQVVILDFMSPECVPCTEVIGELRTVQEAFPGLVIISIDTTQSSDARLQLFAEAHNVTWLLAADTVTQNVAGRYSVRLIPTLVLLNRERQRAYTHVGEVTAATILDEVSQLLASGLLNESAGQFAGTASESPPSFPHGRHPPR